eukprot:Nitzschia sp. Nitz4//scaffold122_size67431//29226//31869//NITZ4_006084-RA/size67431-augustus-gene-0.56-mRNA-1//-1//CDS//3329534400//1229//frame0
MTQYRILPVPRTVVHRYHNFCSLLSTMGVWYDFVFDNAYKVDAQEAESKLRSKYPHLLHANETVELAFKDRGGKGRDKEYFTSHRILIKDGKGIGSKRKNYQSIPYDTILAFSVQSAGSLLDEDCELYVWSSGVPVVSIDFSSSNVDIFQIYQLLNVKVPWSTDRGTSDYVDPVPPNIDVQQTTAGNIIDWLGDNAKQVDAGEIETHFKTEFPILLEDEKVEIAFKSGRDTKAFTNRRILFVDVKGLVGKKIEFLSIPYSSIHAFHVQTAGALLDRDTELRLYTNMLGEHYQINQDFRHGKANLWAIQKVLCNHILGDDKDPLPDVDRYEGHQDSEGGLFGLITGLRFNERPIDAVAIDQIFHSDPPILQGSEHVEMAFQGHRDVTLFTTKRLITIDKKGLFGHKIEYFSVPWERFVAFGVRSAGFMIDFDTEVLLYTELAFYPGEPGSPGDENTPPRPPIPPRPEESCFELDFNKNCADIYKIKYYLSRRIMEINQLERGAPIDLVALTSASPDPQGFERLFQWLGGDQRELDPTELDEEFHTNTQILLDDETVLMAFKAGRDVTLFTNIRIMTIDVQGLVGCKIEYTSLPYRSVHAYSVESAGIWDRDSELNLYTRNRWHLAKLDMDFRSGKTDILQIQKLLTGFVVGLPTDSKIHFGPKNYENHERKPVGWNSLAAGFFDNSKEIEAGEIDSAFHSDIPLLLQEETVLRAFCQARDMYVYTNRRFIIVDTKGLSGQRVKYKSIPYKSIDGFEFETAGHMDRDAEIYCYTTVSDIYSNGIPRSVGVLRTKQSILVKHTDIYEMGKLMLDHTVFGTKPQADYEPEIEVIF